MDFDEVKQLIEEFFNGKFEVKKFLGEGSFAKVYLVNHNYLDTLMAMKIVKDPLNISSNKKEIFREVTLACQLRHENIISIYDAAEISNFEDGKNHAYFVMEYVSGGDLDKYLSSFIENDMFMPISRSLNLVKQILNGLDTLHSATPPIIHRDLKLNNVLLSLNSLADITVKISDFGFAKEVTSSISDIDIAGTRPYMAPELFARNVSTRSDIYAVGVMFYQLLANRYPYDVEKYSNEELIDLKPWKEQLNPPSHYNKHVFEDLDRIVLRCLDANPENRYFNASDLLRDVENAIDKYHSVNVISEININDDYCDEYSEYIINDSIKEAFKLAKHENMLSDAIEILEGEVLRDYHVRKCYSETLRIWKSKNPDLKMISKAFTVNLTGYNYKLACNFLEEAIAYNPSLKDIYQHYIDLWEIFMDLEKHGSLFKSVALLENLMDRSPEIKKRYKNILPILKTYSIDEIVVEAIRLVNLNNLSEGASLMEFAVVASSEIREKYAYKMSLWKQNMKMHFKYPEEIENDSIDYAIDLGTTDSVISYFNNGNPVVIKNHRTGDDFTPSAVLIDDEENIDVGANARDAILENDLNAVSEFKHNMGFSVPFTFEKSSRVMYPEELSAEVLKDLRRSVFNEMGVNIEHAVICVPANSNPIKTKAVNDAAELAGFRSHSLILEPIAVSLAYKLYEKDGIWMIYDLGGGTFNVTLIKSSNGEIEKLATDGLENLGGNAIDWKIVNDLLRPKIVNDLNLENFRRDNPKYVKEFAKLKSAAEECKKELTKLTAADICLDNLFEDYDFTYNLTRNKLSEIIDPLMQYTFKLSRNLLDENNLDEDNLEKIILVGGSSLSPTVRSCISNEFSAEIEYGINPLTVVSKGASIYAGSLEKPQVDVKEEPFSVILNRNRNGIAGKVFCLDDKFSFLGYSIEFENAFECFKVPLDIDGKFIIPLPDGKFAINVLHNDTKVDLDEKSPDMICDDSIKIPFLSDDFVLANGNSSLNDMTTRYVKLMGYMELFKDYSYGVPDDLVEYILRMLEISKRNPIAINQTLIYLNHLESIVSNYKDDLEFSILLENVLDKIEIVKAKNLFEIEDINGIVENRNLSQLKDYYSNLVERYIALDMDSVVEDCFNNLKFEGIYTNNEKLSDELFEKAKYAIKLNDYDGLLDIVNLLYELDERMSK